MVRIYKKRNQSVSLVRLFPNMITILGLCVGLSAVRLAFNEQWELATAFIIFASCIDGIDGFLARKLNATSYFGAQLDSLADFFNFGVAPTLVIYLWMKLSGAMPIKGLAWGVVLFFVVCCALRLARFNCNLDKKTGDTPDFYKNFFTGIPAPAGAIFACGPLIVTFACENDFSGVLSYIAFVQDPYFVCFNVVLAAILMVSRIPTVSFKRISVAQEHIPLVLATAGLIVIFAFIKPWLMVVCIGICYYISLPLYAFKFLKQKKAHLKKNEK